MKKSDGCRKSKCPMCNIIYIEEYYKSQAYKISVGYQGYWIIEYSLYLLPKDDRIDNQNVEK